jgi:plastocyanin
VRRSTLGTLATAALLLAACSDVPDGAVEAQALECPPGEEGCDDIQPVGPGGSMEVEMGNFYFEVTETAAVTGEVEITGINVSDAFHNLIVLGAAEGSEIVEVDGGEEDTATVNVFAGEWTIICDVPGHRAAGMESTITVYATEEELENAQEMGETDVDRDQELDPAAG